MAYVVGYVIQVLCNIIQNKTGTTENKLMRGFLLQTTVFKLFVLIQADFDNILSWNPSFCLDKINVSSNMQI